MGKKSGHKDEIFHIFLYINTTFVYNNAVINTMPDETALIKKRNKKNSYKLKVWNENRTSHLLNVFIMLLTNKFLYSWALKSKLRNISPPPIEPLYIYIAYQDPWPKH